MGVRHVAFVSLTTVALCLSSCAPAARTTATAGEQTSTARCFRTDSIRNFRADRSALYVRSLRDDVFLINTSGGCLDLDSTLSIAIVPTSGGSDNVCVSDPVRIIAPGSSFGSGSCRAFVTKSLTAEEVAALPSRSRP